MHASSDLLTHGLGALMGLIAGAIDAIAGGGGLITLPTLSLMVGPGAHAIGTNKIVGSIGAAMALLVYARTHKVDWALCLVFSLWIALGSTVGGLSTPHLPQELFKWLLAATCPLILWIVWRKDLWVAREAGHVRPRPRGPRALLDTPIVAAGLVVGFYDGAWGPGGGTFMFLALLFVAEMPLFQALAASKFANTCSASAALVTYGAQGYVHPREGLIVAGGMAAGAFLGARFATQRASRIVRPVLAIVVTLLVAKLVMS